MHGAHDSTSNSAPPIFPLRVGSKPPEKKRRREEKPRKKPQEKETTGDQGNADRGEAVDVRI